MSLQVGSKAPSFNLFDTDKKEVKLEDYKGKNLVILFFPLAFTGTCTAELCNIRDTYTQYNNMNAEVIGISIDSVFVLAKYKEAERMNFKLLSDFNKEASTAYGSIYEEFIFGMKGVSKRSAFVIDKEGTIQYIEILENAGEQPSYENILATLSKLN